MNDVIRTSKANDEADSRARLKCFSKESLIDLCVGKDREIAQLKANAPETREQPAPHGVVYDRLGWVCSICGGWNNASSKVNCIHPHTQKASEQHKVTE